MQLVAYGAQDVYLTGNPQITFFKVVYRRHTNFSIESIEIPVEGANFGTTSTIQLLRNGDLANKMYIKTTLPSLFNNTNAGELYINYWCKKVGFALIKSIECIIGGTKIDKHYGIWLDIWYELTHTMEQENAYNKLIGNVRELNDISYLLHNNQIIDKYTVYIPLQFWFNRNIGLSLPLIALQYHDIRFNIEFEKKENLLCIVKDGGFKEGYVTSDNLSDTSLLIDYIYLDQEERRRMAQVGHEYLIEQLQYNNGENLNGHIQKYLLDFNHPCKELIWVAKNNMFNNKNKFITDFTGDESKTLDLAAFTIVKSIFTVIDDNDIIKFEENGWNEFININEPISGIFNNNKIKIKYHIENKNNIDINIIKNKVRFNRDMYYTTDKEYSLVDNIKSLDLYIYSENINGNDNIWIEWNNGIYAYNIKHNLTLDYISIPLDKFNFSMTNNDNINNCFIIQQPFNYGLNLAGNGNILDVAKLQLNGSDRFEYMDYKYFNNIQPLQHHTNTPKDGLYCYSFGLNPEQHQPSGTCNLSRIDTTILLMRFNNYYKKKSYRIQDNILDIYNYYDIIKNGEVHIFAINYNVLRAMSGMCGVAYAN